jgi:hypothetical protein
VALCGDKPNPLTPLGAVVLPLLKIYMQRRTLLAALCNGVFCSKRLRGSPVTEQTNTRCQVRDFLPNFVCLTGAARWALLLAASMQTATWLSAGMGEGEGGEFSLLDWRRARTPATNHEAAHAETAAVAEDGRCCKRARCTSEIASKKTCGRPRPHIFYVVQPVCRKSNPRP